MEVHGGEKTPYGTCSPVTQKTKKNQTHKKKKRKRKKKKKQTKIRKGCQNQGDERKLSGMGRTCQ